jgi:hypothetical protein
MKGLLSPYAISQQESADVPILLKNVSAHRVILPKYHVLGTATPFDGVIESPGQIGDEGDSCKTFKHLPSYLLDLEKRSIENLSLNQANKVHDILIEFLAVFAVDDMDIGLFKGITHKVNTGDSQPVRAKLRRTPLGFQKEEKAHLKNLLDKGVIVPSKSAWAPAPVLACKKMALCGTVLTSGK